VLEFSLLHIVSAHAQLLFYTGEVWLILWLWKQILAKHRFPVLSVLSIFEDWSVVLPPISRTFSSVSTILFHCFFMSHWTFGPPLFHQLGYTRRCGNRWVRIFTTKLTDTFSVSFFLAKLHFSINFDSPSTPLTKTERLMRLTTSDRIRPPANGLLSALMIHSAIGSYISHL
jgi:hypothetical protein